MTPHAGRSLIWAIFESGGQLVLSLGVLILLARMLGPTDLGTAALAIGIVQMLAVLVDTLLHDSIVQRASLTDDHLNSSFWACFGLGLFFCTSVWMIAPWLGRLFDTPVLPMLLSVASLSLLFSGTGGVATAIMRRHFLFKELALRSLCARTLSAVIAIGMVLAGYGVWALICQHLALAAVNTAMVWRSAPWRPRLRFSSKSLYELLGFGILTLGSRLAWLSSARIFTVLVGYFLGVTAVGYISVAQRVVDTLYETLSGAAYNLVLPIFSHQQGNPALLARTYIWSSNLAALTVFPIFAGVAVCAPAIASVFLGESWSAVVPLIEIIAAGAMAQFLFVFTDAVVTAIGKPRHAFIYAVASLGFVLISFLAFPPTNPSQASIIWGLRTLVAAPLLVFAACRLLGKSVAIDSLKGLLIPLGGILAMGITILAINKSYLSAITPLCQLLIDIPLGGTVYGAIMTLFNRAVLRRFIHLIGSGMGWPMFRPEKAIVNRP